LRLSRKVVTNCLCHRFTAQDQRPGHLFRAHAGTPIQLELKAKLTAQDPIRVVEIIKNGQVERRVAFDDVLKSGSLGAVGFQESGWFLVRTITENKETFRFASAAPFYGEIGDARERISKASA